jgi:transposase
MFAPDDVPGIGPIISSAVVAAIGTGDVFSKGRDFGAWLGLVPKHSTGDRTILGKISRCRNRYPRVLFVQAAWVVLVRIRNWERYGLKSQIEAAKRRLHHNVLAIARVNTTSGRRASSRNCDQFHVEDLQHGVGRNAGPS